MMGRRKKKIHVFLAWWLEEGERREGGGHRLSAVPCPQIIQGEIKGRGATMTG